MGNFINCPVRELRRQDVINCFFDSLKELRKTKPFATQNEVIETASMSKAPRFYVTFENARRFISLLMRGKPLPIVNENKVKMYKEIYRRYKTRVKDANARYKYLILESIIEEPAPSFYLDEETFRGIVYKTLRENSGRKAPVKKQQ
jgi:hypothetical protein